MQPQLWRNTAGYRGKDIMGALWHHHNEAQPPPNQRTAAHPSETYPRGNATHQQKHETQKHTQTRNTKTKTQKHTQKHPGAQEPQRAPSTATPPTASPPQTPETDETAAWGREDCKPPIPKEEFATPHEGFCRKPGIEWEHGIKKKR